MGTSKSMPFLPTLNTTLYYDILELNFTLPQYTTQEVLLLHGFASTPVSDFSGQLPSLRTRYRLIAPHLHGYGRSSDRKRYALTVRPYYNLQQLPTTPAYQAVLYQKQSPCAA